MARPVPVLPLVGSTIVPPGLRWPSRSAASISATATRSLIDPPGLSASTLATSCGRRPAPSRLRRTSGVPPIASRIVSLMSVEVGFVTARIPPVCHVCGVFSIMPNDVRQRPDLALDSSAPHARIRDVPNDRPILDATDRAILEALSENARLPNNRLAERVGIAPSTCLARVNALRESGVLLGFHAEIDLAALGRPLQAMIAVRLAVHAREQIEAFTDAVRGLPGVLSVFHMTGVTDYLVWVAATDMQELREFVVDHLATHPAVAHAETSLIYEHRRGPGIWGTVDPAHG